MNTYRWSVLSARYLKLYARTTSTLLQAAHCHCRFTHSLWIVLLTVPKIVDGLFLLSVKRLIILIAAEIWERYTEG